MFARIYYLFAFNYLQNESNIELLAKIKLNIYGDNELKANSDF